MNSMNDRINRVTKVMMLCSLVASIICLGLSVWLMFYTKDHFFTFAAIMFLVATVWLGFNVLRNGKKKNEK